MLTNEQCEKVALTLQGLGWSEVIKPIFAQRANAAIKALCVTPDKREGDAKGMSDDALRARIQECEYVLFAFENEVKVNRMNRMAEITNGTETAPTS